MQVVLIESIAKWLKYCDGVFIICFLEA